MTSHQIADAIGVLSALADACWHPNVGSDAQSNKWNCLRSGIYHLNGELEEMAKKEPQDV